MESVFVEKKECCGCGVCEFVCPVNAVTMTEDEYGYIYPKINQNKCIDCKLCVKNCSFMRDKKFVKPLEAYAAAREDSKRTMMSSSGGAFASIASAFLKNGGVVIGCHLYKSTMLAEHIVVEKEEDLRLIIGSKYVQSDIRKTFDYIKSNIDKKQILFCGTPCQVSAIKEQFTHENLYAVELICHGVPNNKMFIDYMGTLNISKLDNFVFRDKRQGWSFNGVVSYETVAGENKKMKIPHRLSAYLTYFLDTEISRESCYNCPFAKKERIADITLGDFWGIIKTRKDLKEKFDVEKGVSSLIINSVKGRNLLYNVDLKMFVVNYMDISQGQEQLKAPSVHTKKRDVILQLYKDSGWSAVNNYFEKNDLKLSFYIWSLFPAKVQHFIRIILKKR